MKALVTFSENTLFKQDKRDVWKYLFNYGYCTNAMKWAATEKTQGTYTFETADEIRGIFDTWNIPLSGNTIFWEVESNIGGPKEWKQPVGVIEPTRI